MTVLGRPILTHMDLVSAQHLQPTLGPGISCREILTFAFHSVWQRQLAKPTEQSLVFIWHSEIFSSPAIAVLVSKRHECFVIS